ncbi:hypothetical protein [Luteococcus sp.]|uniref:hypothetical protein n=1 Tax=Luteococcus sp. TaxID=1969402 RepID=UPI0037351F30
MELPEQVQAICESFTHALNHSAEGLLEGLYLRGSLCWGEFFTSSDVDYTAVLSRRPQADDLRALEAAHAQVWLDFTDHDFDGHHVVIEDLQRPADQCPPVPCTHAGSFEPEGRTDLNPVAWHELATRAIRVTGRDPRVLGIHAPHEELVAYSRENLAAYWARTARELKLGWLVIGRHDDAVAWSALGVARLHHLLATGEMTSKSGAGRYVQTTLDERWHKLAAEALRIREDPSASSHYGSLSERGKDLRDFVAWAVADGEARAQEARHG